MSKDTINPKRYILTPNQQTTYENWVDERARHKYVYGAYSDMLKKWLADNPCPLPNPVEIREDVIWFAKEMEAKLKANDHKGTWKRETLQYLSMRLTQERKELTDAIASKDKQRIIKECADIANFAMMIADHVNLNI